MTYLVNGKEAQSLSEVAGLLNVAKVTMKDIKSGGKYADVVMVSDAEGDTLQEYADADEVNDPTMDSVEDPENPVEPEPPMDLSEEEEAKAALPSFATLEELKDFIKDLDTPTLEYFAKALKCDWKPSDNANIHRMRVAQSLHPYFFPELIKKPEAKKKGKYGDFSTTELIEMATANEVAWTGSPNEHINRMRLIMALKASGHLVE